MESERLYFRELLSTDVERLYEIYSDQEAMKYRQSPHHLTIEDTYEMLRRNREKKENGYEFRFGIISKENQKLIGSIMYQPIGSKAIIGYSLSKDSWGFGYATEVVGWMINFLKNKNFTSIEAWVLKENLSSCRVLEKNNFKRISQTIYPYSYFYQKMI